MYKYIIQKLNYISLNTFLVLVEHERKYTQCLERNKIIIEKYKLQERYGKNISEKQEHS